MKIRFLVLVEADRAGYVDQVFRGYDWVCVVRLGEEEYPTPPGKRLVSDAAWEVLRRGARMPRAELEKSLAVFGTKSLSHDQHSDAERWCLAELARRDSEEEDYDE